MIGVGRGRDFEGVKVGSSTVFKDLLCFIKINFDNQKYCAEDSDYWEITSSNMGVKISLEKLKHFDNMQVG